MLIDFILWPHMERISVLHKIFPKMELSAHKYPCLHNWVQKMKCLPAVKRTMHPEELHLDFLMSYAKGTPDYDMGL